MASSLHAERYERLRCILVQKRKEALLSQFTVAEKLGKPQSFVSKYENGERRIDLIEFIDIAAAIGFDPASILDEFSTV